ncbi:response regulator [Sinimarinibacterium sp. CAU 1509]|uniref:ANTAR domain-containing response regulator n=1 Tax=Sinimarinibacterium sp. CAU 1509 TaxID=2562283 RepID=UPI0010AB5CBA|nr:response regulator [Sinimarinibacterium sp. CAU 1509]TJY58169.1 response regulator [Sinimarinibacterium sp. CAU 1509]
MSSRKTPAALRVMLVDDDAERLDLMQQAMDASGHRVVARLSSRDDMSLAVDRHRPDVILVDVDAPSRDTLESLGQVTRDRPRPIVLFASQTDPDTTRRAIRAGVSAYVVDGMSPARLKSVIEVAIARFDEHQALRREIENNKIRLADRCDVESAKAMLMQRRKLSESDAYELLRTIAMSRKLKIGDAARALLTVTELL